MLQPSALDLGHCCVLLTARLRISCSPVRDKGAQGAGGHRLPRHAVSCTAQPKWMEGPRRDLSSKWHESRGCCGAPWGRCHRCQVDSMCDKSHSCLLDKRLVVRALGGQWRGGHVLRFASSSSSSLSECSHMPVSLACWVVTSKAICNPPRRLGDCPAGGGGGPAGGALETGGGDDSLQALWCRYGLAGCGMPTNASVHAALPATSTNPVATRLEGSVAVAAVDELIGGQELSTADNTPAISASTAAHASTAAMKAGLAAVARAAQPAVAAAAATVSAAKAGLIVAAHALQPAVSAVAMAPVWGLLLLGSSGALLAAVQLWHCLPNRRLLRRPSDLGGRLQQLLQFGRRR